MDKQRDSLNDYSADTRVVQLHRFHILYIVQHFYILNRNMLPFDCYDNQLTVICTTNVECLLIRTKGNAILKGACNIVQAQRSYNFNLTITS